MSKSGPRGRFLILLIFALIIFIGLASWNGSALGPSSAALAALESDAEVRVTTSADLISFEPVNPTANTGLIFYPGGKVDFRAYAPVLRDIAARGYAVYTPSMPLYLALLDTNAADAIIAAHPEIENWAIAGHSLGGVSAGTYAAGNPEITGVAFWASYPQGDSLANTSIAALSLYGTLDGLTTLEDIENSRPNLPANARFIAIEGGNHAQFGSYGVQEGDNPATISEQQQHDQVSIATAALLDEISR